MVAAALTPAAVAVEEAAVAVVEEEEEDNSGGGTLFGVLKNWDKKLQRYAFIAWKSFHFRVCLE